MTIKTVFQSLASVEIWLFGGAIGLGIIAERLLPYVVVLGICFWFIRWAAGGRFTFGVPFFLPLVFLLISVGVSLYATPLMATSLPLVLSLLIGMLLFFCMLNWANSPHRLAWLLGGFLALAFGLSAAALLLVNWVDKFRFLPALLPNNLAADFTESIHPNVIAGAILLLLVGACAYLAFRWSALRWQLKIVILSAILFMTLILLLTQSRTALIALGISVTLLILLRFKRGWIGVILGLGLVIFLVLQAGPQNVWNSFSREVGGTATLATREDVWLRARLVIQDFPLTGIGMGTFGPVVDAIYPLSPQPVLMPHAHNLFLQIGIDLGLPGLAAWLAVWGGVLFMAWQLYRKNDPMARSLGAAALCTQAAMAVHGLADAVTWDTRPAVLVWAIWGLTAAAWHIYSPEI